jgi:hypothetical protein
VLLSENMWNVLTTLTDEAQNAAVAKAEELGFDKNRGDVPLPESLTNLNFAVNILKDAIRKEKLTQLPLTVQKVILANLGVVSSSIMNLTKGTDEIVNLVNAIEALNTSMWQYGFYNLSEEVLGYQTKLNQLKNLELVISGLKRELDSGIALKKNLEALLGETKSKTEQLHEEQSKSSVQFCQDAEKQTKSLLEAVGKADDLIEKINANVAASNDAAQRAAASLLTVQQNEATAGKLIETTTAKDASITAVEAKIKAFYELIDEYRTKIAATTEEAENTVKSNKTSTGELIATLKHLEDQIKEQIVRATGHSLFHSFQTRQDTLVKSKEFWVKAIAACVILAIGLPVFVILTSNTHDFIFFLKLSMSIPIIYALSFCTLQYSRERKLEEEYAFKASISISLEPYKDLVSKLIDPAQQTEREKFAIFIIDSVSKVFTSPTDKVFETGQRRSGIFRSRDLKDLAEIIKTIKPA